MATGEFGVTAASEIASIRPISRTAEDHLDAQGRRVLTRVWTGIQFRKTPEGFFEPVDETSINSIVSAKGVSTLLRDKTGVYSVGLRTDREMTKAIGLRPDDDQSGRIQFEISAPVVTFDGKSAVATIEAASTFDARTTDLGAFLVQTRRQGTRIMVPVTNKVRDFQIEFRFDLTGCRIEERAGEYWVFKDGGELWFRIVQPQVIDPVTESLVLVGKEDEQEPLQDQIAHSLTENPDGFFTYVKWPGSGFAPEQWPTEVWLDVNINSGTDDRTVNYTTSNNWDTTHDAVTGTSVAAVASTYLPNQAMWTGTVFDFARSFLFFDCTGQSGTVSSAVLYMYGFGTSESQVSAQLGTQNTPVAVADYDAFSGLTYGQVTLVASAYRTISFNAQGISDLQGVVDVEGTFKVCTREYEHDYLDVSSGTNSYDNIYRSANYTSPPYLEITWAAAGGAIMNQLQGPNLGADLFNGAIQ